MKIVKQKQSLQILNLGDDVSLPSKHGDLLPDSIRCIICGPSNCGKTNVMVTLVTDPNGLRFENVYVYSKSLFQPKYQFLKSVLQPIDGIEYFEFSENDAVISPTDAKSNSVFIFDDIVCDRQEKIQKFFSMGRHKDVDVFYLSQSYARTPKHLIRDNVNMLVLFKQDDLNLKHVYEDHVGTDMTLQQFKDVCSECWSRDQYGFLVIDKNKELSGGRYRKGFDGYICLKEK